MSLFRKNSSHDLQPKLKRLQALQTEIYRQLQLLMPDEIAHYDFFQSRVHGSPLLRMDILERHPYTHFVRLTYQFDKNETLEIAPDAHIRIYNDARLAEATSFDPVQGFNRQAPGGEKSLYARPAVQSVSSNEYRTHLLSRPSWFPQLQIFQRSWRQNRALDKWLGYLLHQGHNLTSMQPVSDKISGHQAIPVKQTVRST